MIDLDTVTIEGPDLAGKTTLYTMLHEKSGYKWNIQDRSVLSMLCYSIFYNRDDVEVWRARLDDAVNNLNNRIVVLSPSFSLLEARYLNRGDEIQTLGTLRELHKIFEDESSKIEKYATVMVLRPNHETEFSYDVERVYSWLSNPSRYNLEDIAQEVHTNAAASPTKECSPLTFRLDYTNPESDPSILTHEAEEAYYANMLKGVLTNISNEVSGKNDYGIPQTPKTTRRFIFTQDSCVSLIHTMFRENTMNVHVVCRSSDTVGTFLYDLRFLYYLTSRILRRVNADLKKTKCRLYITLNSAHIVEE